MYMKSTAAVVNEMEYEDIISDYPNDYIQDDQDEKLNGDNDNFLKIVAEHEETNAEDEQRKDSPVQEIQDITTETSLENLDALIERLPDQFPAAS